MTQAQHNAAVKTVAGFKGRPQRLPDLIKKNVDATGGDYLHSLFSALAQTGVCDGSADEHEEKK